MTDSFTLNNKSIGEAYLWLKNKDREAFGEAALLGGFSFDGRKYETPKEIQTLLHALTIATESEQLRDSYTSNGGYSCGAE